jgi:hypothetical protein
MTNWNTPTLSSAYSDVLDGFKARDLDLVMGLDPALVSPTNLPTGSFRWNSANARFETLNSGGAWVASASKYLIDVDLLDGQHGSHYLAWGNLTGKPSTFPATTHTHDDRYFTETESDSRFAASLAASGNNTLLKNKAGATLTSFIPPYAASAGNAATVAGYSVNQNLRTTDGVTFASITTSENAVVNGDLFVGKNGGGDSRAHFYDDTGNTWRTLYFDDSDSSWGVEDGAGSNRRLFHEGHAPTWSEVTSKPTTFTPSTHNHDFGTM